MKLYLGSIPHYSLLLRRKSDVMIKLDTFYIQCPKCRSWLEGKTIRSEMVNQSILYSDGKTLNDNYITEIQKMIVCPACSHWFWIDNYEEPLALKNSPKKVYYTWNTWRFYGIHFSSNEGHLALISHYNKFLSNQKYDAEKEIYFRRFLWWAYNDLVRYRSQMSFKCLISGQMSFLVWYRNRKRLKKGLELFLQHHEDFVNNLRRLLALIENRYTEDDEEFEATNLEVMEIYREIGEHEKAAELLGQVTRRTHYISFIEKKNNNKDPFVFTVTG